MKGVGKAVRRACQSPRRRDYRSKDLCRSRNIKRGLFRPLAQACGSWGHSLYLAVDRPKPPAKGASPFAIPIDNKASSVGSVSDQMVPLGRTRVSGLVRLYGGGFVSSIDL